MQSPRPPSAAGAARPAPNTQKARTQMAAARTIAASQAVGAARVSIRLQSSLRAGPTSGRLFQSRPSTHMGSMSGSNPSMRSSTVARGEPYHGRCLINI